MTRYVFVLSKEDVELASVEAERAHDTTRVLLVNDRLLLDVDEPVTTLAFTRSIHKIRYETTSEEFEEDAARHDWSWVAPPFAVNARDDASLEKRLAAHVWKGVEKEGKEPSVNLQSPQTKVDVFIVNEQTLVTETVWENNEKFGERRAHLRPYNHPTSLHPKVARAMINLAGDRSVENILDPFCGAGGLLLEGALAGKQVTGLDIDARQIRRAEENLAASNVAVMLTVGDATRLSELGSFDAIITDLPYGRNSQLDDEAGTFTKFFTEAVKVTNVLVVGAMNETPLEEYAGKEWKTLHTFSWPLHKSLTKKIYVCERSR